MSETTPLREANLAPKTDKSIGRKIKHPETGQPVSVVRSRVRDGVGVFELADRSLVTHDAVRKANTVHPEPSPSETYVSLPDRMTLIEDALQAVDGIEGLEELSDLKDRMAAAEAKCAALEAKLAVLAIEVEAMTETG